MRGRFTAIETALAASVGGTLLAIFIPTFTHEVRTSKIGEAADQLRVLADGVRAYYQRSHTCLPPSAGPTPADTHVDRHVVRFFEEPGGSVWRALRFDPDQPIRYRYTYEADPNGCNLAPGARVTLRAEGDLDGDGRRSTFERALRVNAERRLVDVGILDIRDRVE